MFEAAVVIRATISVGNARNEFVIFTQTQSWISAQG